MNKEEVFRICKMSINTLYKWVARYQEEDFNGLKDHWITGKPSRLTDEQKCRIADIIDEGSLAYGFMIQVCGM